MKKRRRSQGYCESRIHSVTYPVWTGPAANISLNFASVRFTAKPLALKRIFRLTAEYPNNDGISARAMDRARLNV